ncbi:MAG: methyltransferase domain-containing protein [bacterium]|nr:methyltransferase domain-containing protein [bacterium]
MKNRKFTDQEKFWQSDFDKGYIERNLFTNRELDDLYMKEYGLSRSVMNTRFLGTLKLNNILEVGSSVGNQLALLQSQGHQNLYGVEIFNVAVAIAQTHTKGINIIQGSAFDIPFKDDYFDLVFTSGVLIHIAPKDLKKAMREIYRTSKKYIWGMEYFSEKPQAIDYRGHKDRLWKRDFVQMYLDLFPNLRLVKREKYKYVNGNNVDEMFLLKKI